MCTRAPSACKILQAPWWPDGLARESGGDLGDLAIGQAHREIADLLAERRRGFCLAQTQGSVQGVEAAFIRAHPVTPDPDATEGGGYPSALEALLGPEDGSGGLDIECPEHIAQECLRGFASLLRDLVLKRDGIDLRVDADPQLHQYTDLGHEAHLLFFPESG